MLRAHKRKQKEYLLTIILASFFFLISYLISPFHINGDQIHYTKAYTLVKNKDLMSASVAYVSAIYSFEPIHFFLIWVFSNLGVSKIFLMSLSNSILCVLFTKYLFTKTSNYFFIFVLVITSYYLYVFCFTLEKLKFSIIFMLGFLVYRRRILLLLSLLSHFQMLIAIFVFGASSYVSGFSAKINFKISSKVFLQFILVSLVAFLIFVLYSEYIYSKISFYMSQDSVGKFISLVPSIVMTAYLWYMSQYKKIEILILGIIICIFIFIIGPERINMLMYFAWIYYWPQRIVDKSKASAFFYTTLVLSCYWTYKSIIYLEQVIYLGG